MNSLQGKLQENNAVYDEEFCDVNNGIINTVMLSVMTLAQELEKQFLGLVRSNPQ